MSVSCNRELYLDKNMIPWSLSLSFATQRWMSGVICNSSKIERESLRVGGETCYGVCFLYSTTNKKNTGGRSGCDQLKEQYNVVLYFLYFTLLLYFKLLWLFTELILSILILCFFFSFWGEHFILLDRASYLFCLLEHSLNYGFCNNLSY